MSSNSLDVEIHANVLVTSWGYKFNIFYICSAFDVTVIKYIWICKKKPPKIPHNAEESTAKDKLSMKLVPYVIVYYHIFILDTEIWLV